MKIWYFWIQGRFEILTLIGFFVVSGEMVTHFYNGLLSFHWLILMDEFLVEVLSSFLRFIVVVSIIFSFIKPGSIYVFVIFEAWLYSFDLCSLIYVRVILACDYVLLICNLSCSLLNLIWIYTIKPIEFSWKPLNFREIIMILVKTTYFHEMHIKFVK